MESNDEVRHRLLQEVRLDPDTLCWNYKIRDGAASSITIGNRSFPVYRVSMHLFEDFDLDDPSLICHGCDNQSCINPGHLFVGDRRENNQDYNVKGWRKTHGYWNKGKYIPIVVSKEDFDIAKSLLDEYKCRTITDLISIALRKLQLNS